MSMARGSMLSRRSCIQGMGLALGATTWTLRAPRAQDAAPPILASGGKVTLTRLVNVPDQFVGGEILRAVYARLKIKVEFVDVEAKRALALSSAGAVDGEIQRIANLSKDHPTLLQLKPAINYIEPSVFTKKLEFEVRGWESIRTYHVGIVRGVGSSEAGTRDMPHVERATSLPDLIRMLDRDRFDLLVTDLFSGRVEVKKLGLEGVIRPLSPPLSRIDVYHYLHERHLSFIPEVEAVLLEMNASGELEELRSKLVAELLQQIG
jgi:polar amino acid transport system substrate-binding protein